MSSKLKGWLFGLGILIILVLPIVIDYLAKKNIGVISYNEYIKLTESEDFSLVYFGDTSSKEYANTKEMLSNVKTALGASIKAVNYNSLAEPDLAELTVIAESSPAYVFIKDKEIVYVHEGDLTQTKLTELVEKYQNDVIPDDEVSYKTVETYDAYMKAINTKSVVMTVFGRDTCSWCNKFKPIYNDLAAEYDLAVYYIDSDTFDSAEHTKIMNSGLKIPKSCTDSGKEEALSSGFGTPLTIFTKNGKSIDCISGYVNETVLLEKLKSVGMIK